MLFIIINIQNVEFKEVMLIFPKFIGYVPRTVVVITIPCSSFPMLLKLYRFVTDFIYVYFDIVDHVHLVDYLSLLYVLQQ